MNPRSILTILIFFTPVAAGTADPREEIEATIRASWKAYRARDARAYGEYLHPDVRRMSQRAPGLADGRDAVISGLADEWRAFEKKGESVNETMKLEEMTISVEPGVSTTAATALYWVETKGGTRWDYEDQGLVFQAFTKVDGRWRVLHQIDAWSLGYDRDEDEPGERGFTFDFVQPVKDLDRAVRFYGDFLGKPAGRHGGAAWFDLGLERFVLDSDDLGGATSPSPDRPNGYVRFHVTDLTKVKVKLTGEIREKAGDRYALALDPSGNLFMLLEPNRDAPGAAAPAGPTGLEGDDPALALARDAASAWLRMDAKSLAALHTEDGEWFDAASSRDHGPIAADDLEETLPASFYSLYDRSPAGLAATLAADSPRVLTHGSLQLVSYHRTLSATGPHGFERRAHVTHVVEDGKIRFSMHVPDAHTGAMALALDYIGYPQTDLEKAEKFYRQKMKLGDRYEDDNWYGFWSYEAVFGMYGTEFAESGLPRPGKSNGYASFWIQDARKAHERLVALGSKFPVVPSITMTSGIDDEPGYRQIYATDAEGNGFIFTEYTGKAE